MIELLGSRLKKDGTWSKPRLQVLEIYDREKGKEAGEPIAHLLLERVETRRIDERDGSVFEASIELRFQRILPKFDARRQSPYEAGSFVGGYSKLLEERVSLTSTGVHGNGAVFMDLSGLRGQRIGTYLFNEVVTWAKQWPGAEVKAITLNAGDASPSNKVRRNRLYEQFNIAFSYDDSDNRSGTSKSMKADALTVVDTWEHNIVERSLVDYICELAQRQHDIASDLSAREAAIKELTHWRDRATRHPLRWAFGTLLNRHGDRIVKVGLGGVFVLVLWNTVGRYLRP
ncbi:hypothetical protein SAMN05216567_1326 [Variovorax sp. OK605]|uniref:hypothetical protein n=1 Tax=Variovorax sp. OK605 TaxID=1855317 RepID=UPI0008E7F231|nr:hypothetical protein [Variovorax sp. OK605]SFQ73464.1 hypothetical protein SAMN05216567_1326 [Variovorax sp. OK605]